MRGALIHGVLLVVMLVYGYRTWTRDKTVQPDHGAVVLWDKTESDLVSIELKSEKKDVKLERKGAGADGYWWGTDTTIDKKPKPPKKTDEGSGAGSGSGSAGSADAGSAAGSGSGSGSGSGAPIEYEETRKTREFPLGESGEKQITALLAARALRDLGAPSDDQKKDYKLTDSKMTLTVTFKDGAHTWLVGGAVYGGGDRYVLDQATGKVYVVSKDLVTNLEVGENTLHLADARGFDTTKIEQVTIEAGDKSTAVARIQTGVEGQQVKTWGDPATKKADQTIANFIDNFNNLRPTEYQPGTSASALTPVVKLAYRDDKGRPLGSMTLLKREKPGEPPPNATPDPANPPKPVTEYFVMTEKTRVPALVRKESAERTEQDVPTIFSDHPLEIPKPPPGGPHGGFKPGNGPLPPVPTSPATPVTPGAPAPVTPAPKSPPAHP